MRKLWTHREIDAPAEAVWELLARPENWPAWGPTVRAGALDGDRMEEGATGVVSTVLGLDLPFEITAYESGVRWAWKVAGLDATDHRIEPLRAARCRVGFGVPWVVAPYLAVCRLALRRLSAVASDNALEPRSR